MSMQLACVIFKLTNTDFISPARSKEGSKLDMFSGCEELEKNNISRPNHNLNKER